MTDERWATVAGFTNYQVSDQGRVRDLRRDRIMPLHVGNKVGHLRVTVKPDDGRSYRGLYVHRLVLMAFVGPCPEGMEACHNDGDPINNRLDNLRWDTHSSNMYDRVKHGTHQNSNRTHCPQGHPLDAVKYHGDGTFWQRRCRTCLREQSRAQRARKETCPQGHPFDGIAYHPDGSERQRYCKRCRSESVSKQMTERHAKNRKTHCKWGHPLDGVKKVSWGDGTARYCKTCLRESSHRNYFKKKGQTV